MKGDTGNGPLVVHASLTQFTGDNLALHQIFGLVESFNSDYFCVCCYGRKEDFQVILRQLTNQFNANYEPNIIMISISMV